MFRKMNQTIKFESYVSYVDMVRLENSNGEVMASRRTFDIGVIDYTLPQCDAVKLGAAWYRRVDLVDVNLWEERLKAIRKTL